MIDIVNLFYDNGKLNKNKLKRDWIESNYSDLYDSISEFEKSIEIEVDKYTQLLWHYKNNLTDYPKCDYCNDYNRRFYGIEQGYKLGCSRSCAIQLTRPKSNETRKKNTLEKYGVEHTTQLKSVRDKMKKTCLEKFGTEHATQNINVMNKIKSTNIDKYGTELPIQNTSIRGKMVNTVISKFGVDNVSKSDEIRELIKSRSLEKWGTEYHITSSEVRMKIKETTDNNFFNRLKDIYSEHQTLKLQSYDNGNVMFLCMECDKEFIIKPNLLHQRFFKNDIKICLNCNPHNNKITNGHSEIVTFIEELGINNIVLNNRKLITPYEIDIYLPDYNIGIEFNGVYWHSELVKDKKYHNDKLRMCNEIGIELIQIWEDDWNYKCDIIKSVIKNRLNKNTNIIGARKCEIREVSGKESKVFLDTNHIQGWSVSKWRFGLYYNNELVSLITFGKGRKNLNSIGEQYELIRFCNKLDHTVVGGLSRLWNNFIKLENPNKVISYCDLDIFNGNGYLSIGMKLDSTSINYTWCDGRIRWNRWNFRKDKLVSEGYDGSKSEVDIMLSRGWWRCWGSGNNKYIWIK